MIFLQIMTAFTLAYGAIMDYHKREIPNLVPIVLGLVGLCHGITIGWAILPVRLLEALLVAVIFIIAGQRCGGELPGGDFKLLLALTFLDGIATTTLVLAVCFLVTLLKRRNRHIPLCTYVAPIYLAIQLAIHFAVH